jgi:alkanesulfonate monooxygenase SsuD/methylene tetrahydromethanopterin reductase-like flavin-dependent oxidoreductase (luciferase family)
VADVIGLYIDSADHEEAFRLARFADEAGYAFASTQDHPYLQDNLEVWTLLTAIASRTTRLKVMPNVANLALRPPAMLAKAAATLDLISGGRVLLGVGAGSPAGDAPSYGAPLPSVAALEEALQVLRLMREPGPVSFAGVHHRLEGAMPGPIRRVPLWVGAFRPRTLALTGRYGDGWQSPANLYVPPSAVPERQRIIDEAAEAAGRDPREVRRCYNVVGVIRPGGRGSEEEARPVEGPPEFWVDAIGRYRDELGFDSVVFSPLGDDVRAQAELFAEKVLPSCLP